MEHDAESPEECTCCGPMLREIEELLALAKNLPCPIQDESVKRSEELSPCVP